jgi:hypothetical protein
MLDILLKPLVRLYVNLHGVSLPVYTMCRSLWNGVARGCVDMMTGFCILRCERLAETAGCAYDEYVSHGVRLRAFVFS